MTLSFSMLNFKQESCEYQFLNKVTWRTEHARLNKDSGEVTRFPEIFILIITLYSYRFELEFRLGLQA